MTFAPTVMVTAQFLVLCVFLFRRGGTTGPCVSLSKKEVQGPMTVNMLEKSLVWEETFV